MAIAAIFIPLVHMHKQLRGTYEIGQTSAFLRTCILAFFCFFTAMIFFILLLAIGALG